MHGPHNGPCLLGGITKLKRQFILKYYFSGCQVLISEVLSACQGTCRRIKVLHTSAPPLVHVMSNTERVQIVLHMYGTESPFNETGNHNNQVILSFMDCFSNYKYYWVVLPISKAAVEVAFALCHIFREFSCPSILHFDNMACLLLTLSNKYIRESINFKARHTAKDR